MFKFSISTLLWSIAIVAISLAVVATRTSLREKTIRLKTANEQIADLREKLGLIEVTDTENCHIRYFQDCYSDDISHWRIYCPDASKCQICFAVGILPDDGIPARRVDCPLCQYELVSKRRLPKGAADIVVTIDVGMHSREFCVRSRYEYKDGTFAGGNNIFLGLDDWWPRFYDANLYWIPDCIPRDRTTQFDFNKPFVFVKNAVRNDEGQLKGYMFWVETYDSSVASN
jgi:hypothetical protein